MIIVGELINASRKSVGAAIENNDADAVKKLALDQAENGADYIDVNAGVFVGKEADYLKWLVETVQTAVDNPAALTVRIRGPSKQPWQCTRVPP